MYKKNGPNYFKQQNNTFIYKGKDRIRNQLILDYPIRHNDKLNAFKI